MQQTYSRPYDWPWIEAQVAQTIDVWNGCASTTPPPAPHYDPQQQRQREQAYDKALRAVEREARKAPHTRTERLAAQDRITATFAQFATAALDLEGDAIQLLTGDFLPVGTRLAQWARRFDPSLSMADIVQACRNAWTACGLQPLLGQPIALTPSILGYSLLYPYTDNYLDQAGVSAEAKRRFSQRLRHRLCGETFAGPEPAPGHRDSALSDLVTLIEDQYPRAGFPRVYDCLLAIHRAQEQSIAQSGEAASCPDAALLQLSCAKGGSSVLADACLARGSLTPQEGRFAFEWGVLLQLGDDLQDIREDLQRGSVTLFSRAASLGGPLDGLATQLLAFSDQVADRMEALPHGSATLKQLLRSSWRSLIVGAVADSHQFFTGDFLQQTECSSPFRFAFLRARRDRLTSRQGLYSTLFEAFLEAPDELDDALPLPVPSLAAELSS